MSLYALDTGRIVCSRSNRDLQAAGWIVWAPGGGRQPAAAITGDSCGDPVRQFRTVLGVTPTARATASTSISFSALLHMRHGRIVQSCAALASSSARTGRYLPGCPRGRGGT